MCLLQEALKQHGCEAELRRDSADQPEDGPADEQPKATESQDYGEAEGGTLLTQIRIVDR